ncbi:MAG TPA: hypothetical protein EYQ14_23605 [Gammaproteobacteria bacterium]|nr:hypothetical protein [Gammaproteobacteria bacterium]HIL97998.1 hypothetical protein [Pseudomonadales bacterium]
MHGFIEGFAKVVTHRVIDEQCPWRFNLGNQIAASGNAYCGYSGFFDFPTYQTHGLVIEGSGRACNQNIDLVLL